MSGPVRINTISLERLCKLYDWTPKQVAHRRSRWWTEGVHYVRAAGEIRYKWREIERWIERQGTIELASETSADDVRYATGSTGWRTPKSSPSRIPKLV